MNIVYNCNEKFAVHTAVSILSLFDNNKDVKEIRVYILGNGIHEDSISRFEKIAADCSVQSAGPRSIEVLDLRNYESVLKMLIGNSLSTGPFDLTVLARLFAPSHLPDTVDRYIYLDADTVVRGSLKELYELDLEGKVCAMAAEPTIYEDTRKQLGLSADMPYFNSGMMLVDRLRWEEEKVTGSCIDYYKSLGGNGLSFPDQDLINYCLKGRILAIWQGYNFFSNYHYQSYRSLCKRAGWYAAVMGEETYEKARRDPKVVHFAGAERPWLRGNHNPYEKDYEKYLALSPWKGTPKEGGRENAMRMYHLMNLITLYCPAAREWISAAYYRSRVKK